MSEWQDIATAPKDGTRILVYCKEMDPYIFEAQWRAWSGSWAEGGEWVDIWNNDPIEFANGSAIYPTHFMPLPSPPIQQAKSEVEG